MGFKSTADAISAHFRVAWGAVEPDVPVEYVGLPGHFTGATGLTATDTEPVVNHVRFSVEEAGGQIVAFGTRTDRHVGSALLEVFTLDQQGMGPGRALCDRFNVIFRALTLPAVGLKFWGPGGAVPSVQFIGQENGWLKWLCVAPFQRHETVS